MKGIYRKLCKWALASMVASTVMMSGTIYSQAEEYEYDDLNRVTKVTYEDGSYTTYEYDSNGNLLSVQMHDADSDNTGETGNPNGGGNESGGSESGDNGKEDSGEEDKENPGSDGKENPGDKEAGESDKTEEGSASGNQTEVPKLPEIGNFFEKIMDSIKGFFDKLIQWFQSLFS